MLKLRIIISFHLLPLQSAGVLKADDFRKLGLSLSLSPFVALQTLLRPVHTFAPGFHNVLFHPMRLSVAEFVVYTHMRLLGEPR